MGVIIRAKDRNRVNMRHEQVERYLTSGSTVAEYRRNMAN